MSLVPVPCAGCGVGGCWVSWGSGGWPDALVCTSALVWQRWQLRAPPLASKYSYHQPALGCASWLTKSPCEEKKKKQRHPARCLLSRTAAVCAPVHQGTGYSTRLAVGTGRGRRWILLHQHCQAPLFLLFQLIHQTCLLLLLFPTNHFSSSSAIKTLPC